MLEALVHTFARGPRSPALAKAIDRVNRLEPAYARAVRRVIADGNAVAVDIILPLVDAARERARTSSREELVEAHHALADLMQVVREAAPSSPRIQVVDRLAG